MAGGPAHLKIVAAPEGLWRCGSQEHHQGELEALHFWFHIDRFDRKGANRRLYDYARGENVFAWG
jgi:hypothetical protein